MQSLAIYPSNYPVKRSMTRATMRLTTAAKRCYTAYRMEAVLQSSYDEIDDALSLMCIPFTKSYVRGMLNAPVATVDQAAQRLHDHDMIELGLLKVFSTPQLPATHYQRTYHLKGHREHDFLMLWTAQAYRAMHWFAPVDWTPPEHLPEPSSFPRIDPITSLRLQCIIEGFEPPDLETLTLAHASGLPLFKR